MREASNWAGQLSTVSVERLRISSINGQLFDISAIDFLQRERRDDIATVTIASISPSADWGRSSVLDTFLMLIFAKSVR